MYVKHSSVCVARSHAPRTKVALQRGIFRDLFVAAMVSPAPTNASHLGLSPMQGPTRRELILITALVLLLLSITAPSGRQMSSPHPSLERSLPVQSPELSNQSLSLSIQPRAIQSRLDWGSGPVPQTSVVAQVPGMSYAVKVKWRIVDVFLSVQDGASSTDCMF